MPLGIPLNREPMVATGNLNAHTATVPSTSATMARECGWKQAAGEDYDDGASRQRGGFERNGVKVKRSASMRSQNAGTFSSLRRRSPDLGAGNEDGNPVRKAMTMGRGMYLTAVPCR